MRSSVNYEAIEADIGVATDRQILMLKFDKKHLKCDGFFLKLLLSQSRIKPLLKVCILIKIYFSLGGPTFLLAVNSQIVFMLSSKCIDITSILLLNQTKQFS